jgi:hypothetical protein
VKPGLATGVGSVIFRVSEIAYGGDPYEPEHNHDQGGNGTTVTLIKPTEAAFLPMMGRDN